MIIVAEVNPTNLGSSMDSYGEKSEMSVVNQS